MGRHQARSNQPRAPGIEHAVCWRLTGREGGTHDAIGETSHTEREAPPQSPVACKSFVSAPPTTHCQPSVPVGAPSVGLESTVRLDSQPPCPAATCGEPLSSRDWGPRVRSSQPSPGGSICAHRTALPIGCLESHLRAVRRWSGECGKSSRGVRCCKMQLAGGSEHDGAAAMYQLRSHSRGPSTASQRLASSLQLPFFDVCC